jgi:GNAT superfamily N-acetyltransferase
VGIWSIVCFYVHRAHRRSGVASALLDASVAYAASRGADIVEAYGCKPGDSDPYTGHASMFEDAGFVAVRERGRRTIMRRRLA